MAKEGESPKEDRLSNLVRQLPPILYKYSGLSGPRLEWIRDLIVHSRLYFAKPSQLNDPFECRIPPDFEASELAREAYWREAVARQRLNPRDRKALIRKMVGLTRTPNGRRKLTEQTYQALDKNGVTCFAPSPCKTLMWSYYGEGHTGVAVRFKTDLDELMRFGQLHGMILPVPVRYQQGFPRIEFYAQDQSERALALVGTKSKDWEHEEEWRFLLPGRSGVMRIPPTMVVGVVLGMRATRTTEAQVRSWAAERSLPLKIDRVVNKPGSFELIVEPGD
jgi:hypothetical protein